MSDAKEARDQAVDAVGMSHARWVDEAVAIIRRIAAYREHFTSDHFWRGAEKVGLPKPDEPRALGAAMSRARGEGICEATDRHVLTKRPSRHAAPIRVWRSCIWNGGGQ